VAAVGLALAVVVVVGAIHLRPQPVPATSAAGTPTPRLPDGPESVLQSQFLSASVGWVVTGGSVYAALLRTTDGGRHWQRQLDAETGSNDWGLWFFDALHGVVYGADLHGPAMWRTSDGGQRWTRLETPCRSAPGLVFFLDPGHGWCINHVAGTLQVTQSADDRQEVALLRTTDGGAHWSKVLTTTTEQPVANGLGDDGQKSWIGFRDARVGWIGQSTKGDVAVVYGTTDGGDHWSRQVLAPPPDSRARAQRTWEVGPRETGGLKVSALVAGSFVAGPQAPSVVVGDQYLYRWHGSTWTGPVPLPTGVVSVTSESHWWVMNSSSLVETTDGGVDWHLAGETPAGWLIDRLTMVDPGHGWALASRPRLPAFTAVLRSDDGGRDWTPIAIPG